MDEIEKILQPLYREALNCCCENNFHGKSVSLDEDECVKIVKIVEDLQARIKGLQAGQDELARLSTTILDERDQLREEKKKLIEQVEALQKDISENSRVIGAQKTWTN